MFLALSTFWSVVIPFFVFVPLLLLWLTAPVGGIVAILAVAGGIIRWRGVLGEEEMADLDEPCSRGMA